MKKEIVVIKNTFYMFIRMFFVMFLTLLSTRFLLKILGLETYGIYDLIFGVVLLFNVFSGSLTTALQRFYNISIDSIVELEQVYSVSIHIFLIIGLLILILGGLVSVPAVNNLNLPLGSVNLASQFFYLCVINLFFMILRMPFIAFLISNEKMGIYSIISVFETILKFIGILVLGVNAKFFDNALIVYGYILNTVTILITLAYIVINYTVLEMPKFKFVVEGKYYKSILGFSTWTFLGSSSVLISQQGLSILLNKFFSVTLNAVNSISQQVYTAIYQFVNSFQVAYSPFLMKTYAQGDIFKVRKLIILFSKITFIIYFAVAFPLFIFMEPILKLWLGYVPDYALIFTKLVIFLIFFEVFSAPLWTVIQASGEIQTYQIIISILFILNLPLAYISFRLISCPEVFLYTKIIINVLVYLYRLSVVKSLTHLSLSTYFKLFLNKIFYIFLSFVPLVLLYNFLSLQINLYSLIFYFILYLINLALSVFFLLLSLDERKIILHRFLKGNI
ncbi:hypothetical protein ACT4X4_15780 [Acinetobacter baumannii]